MRNRRFGPGASRLHAAHPLEPPFYGGLSRNVDSPIRRMVTVCLPAPPPGPLGPCLGCFRNRLPPHSCAWGVLPLAWVAASWRSILPPPLRGRCPEGTEGGRSPLLFLQGFRGAVFLSFAGAGPQPLSQTARPGPEARRRDSKKGGLMPPLPPIWPGGHYTAPRLQ